MNNKTQIAELAQNIIEQVADYGAASQESFDLAMKTTITLLQPVFNQLEAKESELAKEKEHSANFEQEANLYHGKCEAAEARIAGIEKNLDAALHREKRVERQLLAKEAELAAMRGDAEPVAWTDEQELRDLAKHGCAYLFKADPVSPHADPHRVIKLFTNAQPVQMVRAEHAEWSQATFGNVGPVGPLKHLSKEAIEAAEAPDDLSEWADIQFLFWDAQRRAGITDAQIEQAMIEKLAVNKARIWPEPKDGEPRMHVKSADGEGD